MDQILSQKKVIFGTSSGATAYIYMALVGFWSDLNRSTSTIENLRELQKYSEKLAYESTCCRLRAEGIQTQIMDEQEKVHAWIAGVTEDLLRMRRIQHAQPAWAQPTLNPYQSVQPAPPSAPSQPASSSSASMVPVKPAPVNRNPSISDSLYMVQSEQSIAKGSTELAETRAR